GAAWERRGSERDNRLGLARAPNKKPEPTGEKMKSDTGAAALRGEENRPAAAAAEIVIVAVPYASHESILDEIKSAVAGKIVVDAVVPLVPPKISVVKFPPDGSAALPAQRLLAGTAPVRAAFHNATAATLTSTAAGV